MAEYFDSAYIQPKRLTGELRGSIVFGVPGASAYEVAVWNGFVGTEDEWLATLVGPDGLSAYELAVTKGYEGTVSEWLDTLRGLSAYEIAVAEGFEGTPKEWLDSLQGPSAYEVALANGFEGTEAEWLDSLVGGLSEEDAKRIQDMEKAISDLQYVPIAIDALSVVPARAEMGENVDSVTVSWMTNKAPVTLSLNGEELDPGTTLWGSGALGADAYTGTTKFTLKATDERGKEATKSCYLTFYNGVYYGAEPIPETVDSAFILGLATKILTDTRKRTFTVTAAEGEYIWYCYPKRMGAAAFKVGGFEGGFDHVEEVSCTNALSYTEDYYVYRSDESGLGSVTMEVK